MHRGNGGINGSPREDGVLLITKVARTCVAEGSTSAEIGCRRLTGMLVVGNSLVNDES
jgi:hypothetical protein